MRLPDVGFKLNQIKIQQQLTGKDPLEQLDVVHDSVAHFSNSISKSDDSFGERLADEGEVRTLEIVKSMDDLSIEAMLWKLRKLKHVSQRFEETIREELQLRKLENKR